MEEEVRRAISRKIQYQKAMFCFVYWVFFLITLWNNRGGNYSALKLEDLPWPFLHNKPYFTFALSMSPLPSREPYMPCYRVKAHVVDYSESLNGFKQGNSKSQFATLWLIVMDMTNMADRCHTNSALFLVCLPALQKAKNYISQALSPGSWDLGLGSHVYSCKIWRQRWGLLSGVGCLLLASMNMRSDAYAACPECGH